MAPMRRTPGKKGVRVRVWGLTAVLIALAVGFAVHIHIGSAFGQDQPSEQDVRSPPDVEPGDGPPAEADTPESDEKDTVGKPPPGQSGLKVPRFVSLRSGEVNVRTGPGTRYPVEWMFQRRGLPVEITAEFGTWRRIRDGQGAEGWVHRSMLSGKRTAVIASAVETLHRRASADSPAVAKAQQGVIASVRTCRDSWCEIDTQGFRGWVPETSLWGVYPNETIK
jgi:SH3-like domain-containing protein